MRPGAERIGIESNIDELMITACKNPDETIAVQILNQGNNAIKFSLKIGAKSADLEIPGSALQTVILN